MRPAKWIASAVISLAAAGSAQLLTTHPVPKRLLEPVELETVDWRMRSLPAPARDSGSVVLVLLDEEMIEEWPYLSPFPRAPLADLIDVVAGAGATAIGLDVFLDRRYPGLDIFGDGDRRLRESIRRAGNVVLAAETEATAEGRKLRQPDRFFRDVAAGVAVADLPVPYETVREATLTLGTRDGLMAGFPLALYSRHRKVLPSAAMAGFVSDGLGVASAPDARDRAAAGMNLPLLFRAPPSRVDRDDGAFPAFAGSTLLALGSAVPPEWFRGKVVMIGSGYHSEDRFRSPFFARTDSTGVPFGWTYGVEIHATALENLLAEYRFRRVPVGAALAIFLLLAFIVAVAVSWRGVTWGAGAAGGAFVATWMAAWWVFAADHVQLPLIGSTLAIGIAFLGSTTYGYLGEGRDKRAIRNAFAKYAPREVVDQIVADPSLLRLGGERRVISILFSDVVGFSRIAESTEPELLVRILNEYLDAMSRIVLDERGTVDKYIGDAVMALFGAPTSLPNHALHSCRTALRMQRELARLNQRWSGQGYPALYIRIGIHTGEPVVGNIGGSERFDYTALGDDVNLAARLEPTCKRYKVQIIISEETLRAAGEAVIARELDLIAVYGKTEPTRIFELIGLKGETPSLSPEFLARFDQGLRAYRERDFGLALQRFQEAAEIVPGDGPTEVYLKRCARFVTTPPPLDWDSVEHPEEK